MEVTGGTSERTPGSLRFTTFGGLVATREGEPVALGRPKQRLVLALLLLEAGRVVPTERLVSLLWEDDGPKERSSLQAYISNLRRVLEPDRPPGSASSVLARKAPGYVIEVDRDVVDLFCFEQLVDAGGRALADGDDQTASSAFDRALALGDSGLLPEFPDVPAVVGARDRTARLVGATLEARTDIALRAGNAEAAVRLLEPILAEHPMRERLQTLAALALYRTGRQADALRVLGDLRERLVDAAGLDAGPEVAALEQQILNHDPALLETPRPPAAHPITPSPSPAEVGSFFGREPAMRVLTAALQSGGIVTVTGEAGIGKTTLLDHFAAGVERPVAMSTCPETGGAPPFWPFADVGEQLRRAGALDDELIVSGGGHADAFAVARRLGALLRSAGPTLVVIDDLHWADADTLLALSHLVASLRSSPTLLVCGSRPIAPDAPEPLVVCFDELTRARVAAVELAAFDERATSAFIAARVDHEVPSEVVAYVQDRTGGNPLFVRELTELLAAEDRLEDPSVAERGSAVPSGVSFVVRRRVSRLGTPEAQQLLSVASVLGSPFSSAVLGDVIEVDPVVIGERLAPALDAGLVQPADEPGSYRFSHALVADALEAELNAVRKAAIHAAAARSLATRYPGDEHAALVAHHAFAGLDAGAAALAVDAATRAARLAEARSASFEAARHGEHAVIALDRSRPHDAEARVLARNELARALLRSDQVLEARSVVVSALEIALGLDDPVLLGSTAMLLSPVGVYTPLPHGGRDPVVVSLLETVLDRLPDDALGFRSRALGALVIWSYHHDDPARLDRYSEEALTLARLDGDPLTVAYALHTRAFAYYQPGGAAVRLEAAEEMVACCESAGLGDDLLLLAHLHALFAEHDLAAFDAVERRLASCVPLMNRPVGDGPRSQLGQFRAHFELLRGRQADAVAHFDETYEVFRRSRPHQAELYQLVQRLTFAADLGGLSELLDEEMAEQLGGFDLTRSLWLPVSLFELGRGEEARERVPFARGTVPSSPSDYLTTTNDVAAAFLAAETGDEVAAAILRERLEPRSGEWAGGFMAAPFGLVDLALARLAATVGDDQSARRWFDVAVTGHERIGAVSWLARTLVFQAEHLLEGGGADDRAIATHALDRAGGIVARYDLPIIAARLDRVRAAHLR